MNRDTLTAAVVAIAGVIGLALAAASIDTPHDTSGRDGEEGPGTPPRERPDPEPSTIELPFEIGLPEFLAELLFVILVIVVLAYIAKEWRPALRYLLLLALAVLAVYLIVELLSLVGSSSEVQDALEGMVSRAGDEPGADGSPSLGEWMPILLLIGGIVAFIITAIVVLGGGNRDTEEPVVDEPHPEVAAELGSVAGRAAHRIETGEDHENEVYRAWTEMIDLLDLGSPSESTPRAFADKATEAGLDPTDVADLTDVFVQVRYGDRPASTERETTAISILRRIEQRYAGADE